PAGLVPGCTDALVVDPPCCAPLVVQLLATQTGTFAFTGALAESDGDRAVELTWAVPADCVADCPRSASAGPAVARAIRSTPSVSMRFIVLFLLLRTNKVRDQPPNPPSAALWRGV